MPSLASPFSSGATVDAPTLPSRSRVLLLTTDKSQYGGPMPIQSVEV
jgi:hypothetical protein